MVFNEVSKHGGARANFVHNLLLFIYFGEFYTFSGDGGGNSVNSRNWVGSGACGQKTRYFFSNKSVKTESKEFSLKTWPGFVWEERIVLKY